MKVFQTLSLVLLVLALEQTCAFQNVGISSRRAFASPRKPAAAPLQAAFISELAEIYSYGMTKYYLATQSVTGGVLCGVGDAMAQVKERVFDTEDSDDDDQEQNTIPDFTRMDGDSIDLKRVLRFALKGLGGGIIWSQWYSISDEWSLTLTNDFFHMLMTSDDAVFSDGIHRAVRTLCSITLEQMVACPLVYALWDIPFPMIMSGAPVESVPGQVKDKIGGLLIQNAKVWSFVNIIIYNIPVEFRLLAMSTADVFWQAVVAGVAAEATADAEGDSDEGEEPKVVTRRLTE